MRDLGAEIRIGSFCHSTVLLVGLESCSSLSSRSNDLEKVTGPREGITGCRGFLLSTISTYQTLGIFGIKLFYRALLTQLKKPFGNPSNTAKVIHKTIWLNPHMPINCLVPLWL